MSYKEIIKEINALFNNFTGIIEHSDGSKQWLVKGKIHRLDGPAVELVNRDKEWWVDGKQVTELEHELLCNMMKLKGML